MITLLELTRIYPFAGLRAATYIDWINHSMDEFDIDSNARIASFLAQVGHESQQLRCVEENLNYSTAGLMTNFSRHFNGVAEAMQYAHQPEAIANRVYANRMGNGDEASGDGWRYRGMGFIQRTGHDGHLACATYFKIPLEKIGDWLRTPEGACRSAGEFWHSNGLNFLADAGDQVGVTGRVNGGIEGLADRLALFQAAKEVLQ